MLEYPVIAICSFKKKKQTNKQKPNKNQPLLPKPTKVERKKSAEQLKSIIWHI